MLFPDEAQMTEKHEDLRDTGIDTGHNHPL